MRFRTALLYPLLAATAPGLWAQTSQHRLGGESLDVWVTASYDPVAGTGTPGEAIVFLAETGPRIRRIDTATGAFTLESITPLAAALPSKSEALHGIFVTNDRSYGVAVGSNGTGLWMTLNSGTWRSFSVNPTSITTPGSNLWKAYWDDSVGQFGIVAGENDTLVYTETLKGTSWTNATTPVVPAGKRRHFYSLAFSDQSSSTVRYGIAGYRLEWVPGTDPATPAGFGFLVTTDGKTWTDAPNVGTPPVASTPTLPEFFVWDIDFQPGSTTVATAVGGLALGNGEGFAGRTTDGGNTWTWSLPVCHTLNLPLGLCPTTSSGPSTPTPCLGETRTVGTEQAPTFATLYGVAMHSDGTAVATSYGAATWKYQPASGTWLENKDTAQFATGPMWGCDAWEDPGLGPIPPKDHLWINGLFGDVRNSSDRGATYQQWTIGSGHTAASPVFDRAWRLQDVALATSGKAWAVGQRTLIAFSDDGGDTWTPRQLHAASGPRLNHVAASDTDHAVAITAAEVLFTTNQNACWNSPATPPATTGITLRDVVWHNTSGSNTRFWLTGTGAQLWVSDDTGNTWTTVPCSPALPTGFDARSIAFGGSNTAILVGELAGQAEAYMLTNVLSSGVPTLVPTDICSLSVPRLNAVAVGGSRAYAVGDQGTILTYTAGALAAVTPASPTTEDLLSVCAAWSGAGAHHFFAGGMKGTLLRKLPGGDWEQFGSSTTDALTGLSFRSSTLGLATGLNSDPTSPMNPGTPASWGDSAIVKIQ